MPFVRVSRDKRGYELISLLHISGRRGRPSKPRLLYAFRTPPGVKVGREPFDESVRQELEAQNPGVVFDWKKLSDIPVPSPDVEYWRERRRAEKAVKQALRAAEQVEGQAGESPAELAPETADESECSAQEPIVEATADDAWTEAGEAEPPTVPGVTPSETDPAIGAAASGGRRRRRRGGRRHRGPRPSVASAAPEGGAGVKAAADAAPSEPPKVPEEPSKEA